MAIHLLEPFTYINWKILYFLLGCLTAHYVSRDTQRNKSVMSKLLLEH
jgi:hypothetical protein